MQHLETSCISLKNHSQASKNVPDIISTLIGPEWFYRETSLIDFITVVVVIASVFMSGSYRTYTTKQKRYTFFQTGFLLIALAYLLKAGLSLLMYMYTEQTASWLTPEILFSFIFIHHLLLLTGFYLLYAIYNKQTPRDIIWILSLLSIITWMSVQRVAALHTTLFVLLALLTSTFIAQRRKNAITRLLAAGFVTLSSSQLIFIFKHHTALYIIAEALQLIGYLLLLIALIKIRIHGKKKITNRHHP